MADVPTFKKFVSEDELEEQKRKRQEEWEKVRRPDQPLEAPEEEHDPRSLYDRLQEQKDKKQQEYEENFKLKNQVKGLESDEVEFLEFVSDKQSEITRAREKETEDMLLEYRNAVVNQSAEKQLSPDKKSVKTVPGSSQIKKSQSSLLAGAVKRKSESPGYRENQNTKKAKSEEGVGSSVETVEPNGQMAQVIGILPGLGAYSGSSSESSDSSDSESDVDTRMFSKRQVCVEHRH